MQLTRNTVSLCRECYKEIPATISANGSGVRMVKLCTEHGKQESMVERDSLFYSIINSMGSKSIYDGYLIDVTRRCNLRCEYCYYPLEHEDKEGRFTISRIMQDCAANRRFAPFTLTGGEPTTRPDIAELIEAVSCIGPTEMLTNGVKLAEPDFFNRIVPLLRRESLVGIHMSIHHQETDKWEGALENFRNSGLKVGSCLIVIDSPEQFAWALETAYKHSDTVLFWRIKAASKLWNEKKPPATDQGESRIYVSDMLNWLDKVGGYTMITHRPGTDIPVGNKSVFVNVFWRGIYLMLVAWHDVHNVDLLDINCPPYYRARNGEVANLITACLINEGMEKGFCKGEPLAKC